MASRTTFSRSLGSLRSSLRSQPVQSTGKRYAGGGSYNAPTGWLFGEKPLPAGQKRKREDWELLFHWGMLTPIVLTVLFQTMSPDTSIEAWSKDQAKKRMEERGDLPVYTPPKDNTISYEEWDRREAARLASQGKH